MPYQNERSSFLLFEQWCKRTPGQPEKTWHPYLSCLPDQLDVLQEFQAIVHDRIDIVFLELCVIAVDHGPVLGEVAREEIAEPNVTGFLVSGPEQC